MCRSHKKFPLSIVSASFHTQADLFMTSSHSSGESSAPVRLFCYHYHCLLRLNLSTKFFLRRWQAIIGWAIRRPPRPIPSPITVNTSTTGLIRFTRCVTVPPFVCLHIRESYVMLVIQCLGGPFGRVSRSLFVTVLFIPSQPLEWPSS